MNKNRNKQFSSRRVIDWWHHFLLKSQQIESNLWNLWNRHKLREWIRHGHIVTFTFSWTAWFLLFFSAISAICNRFSWKYFTENCRYFNTCRNVQLLKSSLKCHAFWTSWPWEKIIMLGRFREKQERIDWEISRKTLRFWTIWFCTVFYGSD